MTADEATIAWYQAQAPHYTFSHAQAPSRHLDAFLDRLDPGAHVLELGCGGGRDAARMIERGFDVDATDGTPARVRKARERFDVPARVMRFNELECDGAYDAVWAHASLLHVPRAGLPQILQRIRRALRPAGWHFASYKLGSGEGRDRLGRLHNFPDPAWLERTYAAAGFEIDGCESYGESGADGTAREWLALTLRHP